MAYKRKHIMQMCSTVLEDFMDQVEDPAPEITRIAGDCAYCRRPWTEGATECEGCGAVTLDRDLLPRPDLPTHPMLTGWDDFYNDRARTTRLHDEVTK